MKTSPASIRASIAASSFRLQCLRNGDSVRPSASALAQLQARGLATQTPATFKSPSTLSQCSKRPSLQTSHSSPLKQLVASYRTADQPPKEWAPPTDAAGVHKYLLNLLPNLEFPEKLALRMVTHSSWKGGIEGNNARLAFLGRRVLDSYLHLFLFSASSRGELQDLTSADSSQTTLNYKKVAKNALDAKSLGEYVGRAWQTEQVLRWVSAAPGSRGRTAGSNGADSVAGSAVEAIMGGIFHQFGANVAHRVFHTRILPHLKPKLPRPVHAYIDEVCLELGGPTSVVSEDQIILNASNSRTPHSNLSQETARRAASAHGL